METEENLEKLKNKKNISNIIQESSKDSNVANPILLPFDANDPNRELNQEDKNKDYFELKEEEPFLIQFPRIIPFDIPEQVEAKKLELTEENINDSSNFYEKKFVNSFSLLGVDQNIGKLRIYKSGKMKLKIGNVEFNVTQGISNSFSTDLFYQSDTQGFILGKLKSEKLLVSPEV
jgi:DNA-directed RNA polymerase III subunit RPC4